MFRNMNLEESGRVLKEAYYTFVSIQLYLDLMYWTVLCPFHIFRSSNDDDWHVLMTIHHNLYGTEIENGSLQGANNHNTGDIY